jgi:hypothetical protein
VRLRFWIVLFLAVASTSQGQLSEPALPPVYRCSDSDITANSGKVARYSGFYEAEFEGSAFKLSHAPCEVWLTGDVCPIFGKGNCVKGAKVKAWIEIEGVLGGAGLFGHFGMWERELRVTHVIKVRRIKE